MVIISGVPIFRIFTVYVNGMLRYGGGGGDSLDKLGGIFTSFLSET